MKIKLLTMASVFTALSFINASVHADDARQDNQSIRQDRQE